MEEEQSPAAPLEPAPHPPQRSAGDAVIVIKRTHFNYVVIAVVFLIVGTSMGWMLAGGAGGSFSGDAMATSISVAIENAGFVRATPTPGPIKVSLDDDPSWGPANAPITMVEFSDFQCPYCGAFERDTYGQIRQVYGDKIHFVYRDMPLVDIHPFAYQSALAANCANEQGAYWSYHDLLFANQQDLSLDALIKYAGQLKLDTDKFSQCLKSGKYSAEVNHDMQDAESYGVSGTPTFFINGLPIVGAEPFSEFAKLIDAQLVEKGIGADSGAESTQPPAS
jgi:protein-disulfide isomerase